MTAQHKHVGGTSLQAKEIAAGLSLLSVHADVRLFSIVPASSMETRRYWDIAVSGGRRMLQDCLLMLVSEAPGGRAV